MAFLRTLAVASVVVVPDVAGLVSCPGPLSGARRRTALRSPPATAPPPLPESGSGLRPSRKSRGVALAASKDASGGALMDPGLKLVVCLLIDLVGMSTYAIPVAGEGADLAWAPVSALLVNYLFGNGPITALALVEELLPGFDIIPTATIAWFLENAQRNDDNGGGAGGGPRPPPQPTPRRPPSDDAKGWRAGAIDV